MELKLALYDFQQRLLQANHLMSIQKIGCFVFVINVVDDSFVFKLVENDITMSINDEVDRIDVTISGNLDVVMKLVYGHQPLRTLQKNEELLVEGRYSAVLKAETIFYLNQFETNG